MLPPKSFKHDLPDRLSEDEVPLMYPCCCSHEYELDAVAHWLWQPTQSLEKPSPFQIDDHVGAVPLVAQPLVPPLLLLDPLPLLDPARLLDPLLDDPPEEPTPSPPELLPPELLPPELLPDELAEPELPPLEGAPPSTGPTAPELLAELPPPPELEPWPWAPPELDPLVDVSASTSVVVSLPPTPAGAVPLLGGTSSLDEPP